MTSYFARKPWNNSYQLNSWPFSFKLYHLNTFYLGFNSVSVMSLAFIVPERNTLKLKIQEYFDVQRRSSFHLKEFHTYPASLCIAGSISSFDCRKVDFYFLWEKKHVNHIQEIQLLCLKGLAVFHLLPLSHFSVSATQRSGICCFHQSLKSFEQDEKKEGTEIKTYMFMLRKRIQFNTIL